jgi:hypothetical protein
MKNQMVLLFGGLMLAAQAQGAANSAFVTDAASSVSLGAEAQTSVVLNVFHHKADGIRCGVRLVASDGKADLSRMAGQLEISQDDRPLTAKFSTDPGDDREVSYAFTREVMFISKVEIKTRSGRPLSEELKSSGVSVAAQDCEPAKTEGPVMVAGDR